jgi:hypothetical protein
MRGKAVASRQVAMLFPPVSIKPGNPAIIRSPVIGRYFLEQPNFYLTGIFVAYGIFSLGMLSPGPNILSVIGTSMASDSLAGIGKRAATRPYTDLFWRFFHA